MNEEIKKGDYVRTKRDFPSCWAVSPRRRDNNTNPWVVKGDIFKVERVSNDLVYYKLQGFNPPTEEDFVWRKDVEKVYRPPRNSWIHGRGLPSTVTIFYTLLSVAIAALGILKEGRTMESVLQDESIHKAIVYLFVTLCGLLGVNLTWASLGSIARGFAKAGDRRRRIKAEEYEKEVKEEEAEEARKAEAEENRLELLAAAKKAESDYIASIITTTIQAQGQKDQDCIRGKTLPDGMEYNDILKPKVGDIVRVVEPNDGNLMLNGHQARAGDIGIIAGVCDTIDAVTLLKGNNTWAKNLKLLYRPA
jgi:hypothetical protein